MMTGKISLEGMEFFAYHGCLPEERENGNRFEVDVEVDTDITAALRSGNLDEALNYADVYQLIKQEMDIRSDLLEPLVRRILDGIFRVFPDVEWAKVKIRKLNPPKMGKTRSVAVVMEGRKPQKNGQTQ